MPRLTALRKHRRAAINVKATPVPVRIIDSDHAAPLCCRR